MDEEPTNAAAEWEYRLVPLINDRDFMETEGLDLLSEDFVRYDRRRLTSQPPGDRQAWLDQMFAFEELAGDWPEFSLTEVLAVRGERLCACSWSTRLRNLDEIPFVIVTQLDELLSRAQVFCFYDPEDVGLALAELDRLHDELTHG